MNNIGIMVVAGTCMTLSVASVTARKPGGLHMASAIASVMEGKTHAMRGVTARIEPYRDAGEESDCVQWKNNLPVNARVEYQVTVFDNASGTQEARDRSVLLTPGGVFTTDFKGHSLGRLVGVKIVDVDKRD